MQKRDPASWAATAPRSEIDVCGTLNARYATYAETLSPRSCHILLANLRPPGQTAYVIPRGYAFDYITCANYTFEILGWVMFAFATRTLTAFLFIAAGAYQMAVWAKAKHARMLKVRSSLAHMPVKAL